MEAIILMRNLIKVWNRSFFFLTIMFNLALAQQDTFQLESKRIAGSILIDGHSLDYL